MAGTANPGELFRPGTISDVLWKPLQKLEDRRGWLCELFRHDELPETCHPEMAYVSMSLPGIARGPHEHLDQADHFCFIGPSNFKIYLWDNRAASPTFRTRQTAIVGEDNSSVVVVPAGVVHAYRNIGNVPGWVINCPNRLYKGRGRKQPVDEIRHDEDPNTVFVLD